MRRDASELLEFGKEVVDHIAIAVLVLVGCVLIFSICFRRIIAFAVDLCEQHIGVVSFIGQDRRRLDLLYQCLGLCDIVDLSAG